MYYSLFLVWPWNIHQILNSHAFLLNIYKAKIVWVLIKQKILQQWNILNTRLSWTYFGKEVFPNEVVLTRWLKKIKLIGTCISVLVLQRWKINTMHNLADMHILCTIKLFRVHCTNTVDSVAYPVASSSNYITLHWSVQLVESWNGNEARVKNSLAMAFWAADITVLLLDWDRCRRRDVLIADCLACYLRARCYIQVWPVC